MKYHKIEEMKQGQTIRFDLNTYKLSNLRRMICYYGGEKVFKSKKTDKYLFVTRL